MSKIFYVRSDKDTHFTGAMNQHVGELESLEFPDDLKKLNVREVVIETLSIIFKQAALDWDVYLWSTADAGNVDPDLDKFITYVNFASSTGKQIAAAGNFLYSQVYLEIPYRCAMPAANTQIHTTLVNRHATAKNNLAGGGDVVVIFGVRPVLS